MPRPERQQIVLELLKDLRGLDPLKQLVWSELNYQRVNQPLPRQGWSDSAARALAEDPVLFAAGGANNDFHVIYARLASDRLLLGLERPVVSRLLRDHPYALFVFSNNARDYWHFLNVKHDDQAQKRRLFRRITIGPEERLRTASERLALLDLASIGHDLFGLSPLAIQERHDEAFDVEAVTKQFFEEYKALYGILQDDLAHQTNDRSWAHDYALQFINRVMFLYFIQRKRWLGEDTDFLRSFWESYQAARQSRDSFFERWLKVLFFEAFNNRFHGGHRHFPDEIKQALATAPYLNGGLFLENDLDRQYAFTLADTRFAQVFTFLERYNFTISEDSPLDQEVAVDPEMIGKVYESLVNVEETSADQRSAVGIFYTPRTEIDLMCRLALVDYLSNHLGAERKSLLYEAIFALEQDEKSEADRALAQAGLWPDLDAHLREITILDPACGSGSFLVGMLHILDDLEERANCQLGRHESRYDRKKRIIGQSLYGVDVMDWACHVAELRLWLALIVDAEFTREDLHVRREPLLPHFTFKIRCGDSLVQEVGGINLGHIRGSYDIPRELKARITRLKTEKLKFYTSDPTCQFRSAEQAKQEELKLFRDILDARLHKLQEEIKALRRKIEGPQERQIRLDGTVEEQPHQMALEAAEWQKQVEGLTGELERVTLAREALKNPKNVPFVWDVAFVEIFTPPRSLPARGEGEGGGGFDIVIGNPPYVRQENIADPRLLPDQVRTENKKAYKAKLARSVYQAFPRYFGYKPSTEAVARKLDAKSDLYVYFYFHGLSLLNPKGSFCFITSNSWLDVGYGADLQEFLLKHGHVKVILDNQAKRSFAQTDVNTVIVLFSPPEETRDWGLDQTARFVMFKAPFEHILSPVIFEEIEQATDRKATPEYRVFPIRQKALLEEGCELPGEEAAPSDKSAIRNRKSAISHGPLIKVARYIGNKWGGKYLRAPDIYWTILEKGKGKLVRLGDIAEVRFGIKTGANEFFYLDEARIQEWGVEKEFLRPVIKSPKECKRILIDPKDLSFKIFMCHKDKKDLKGTAALEYIKWGESQGFHKRPSCAGRARWWDVGERQVGQLACMMSMNDRHPFWINGKSLLDARLYDIYCQESQVLGLAMSLNSTITPLFIELTARANLGEGALDFKVYEAAALPVLNVSAEAEPSLFRRDVLPLQEELAQPDRRALDAIIFNALGLTQGERDAVYEAVINLVEARLKKAESV